VKLQIENFGQHEKLLFDVQAGEVMFGVGKNRVGKSTIRDAIEFVLLGSCLIRGFKTLKETRAEMIRNGASSARVTFQAKGLSVRRTITNRGGHKIEVGKGKAWIEVNATEYASHMPWDPDGLRIALDCDRFFDMDEAHRRAVLISVKDDEGVTADDIWEAFGKALTSYADEDPERQGRLRGLCEVVALESFKAGNDQAVEERRVAKRLFADAEQKLSNMDTPSGDLNGIDCTAGTVQEHGERLAELEGQLETAQSNQARSAGSLSGQIEEAERAFTTAQTTNEETRALRVDFDSGEEKQPAEWSPEALDRLKGKLEKVRDKAIEEARKNNGKKAGLETSLHDIKERIDSALSAPEHPGNCPAVPFEMKCSVKAATFTKAYQAAGGGDEGRQALEKEADELREEIEGLRTIDADLVDNVTEIGERLGKVRAAITDTAVMLEKMKTARLSMEETDEHLQQLTTQVEQSEEGPSEEDIQEIADQVQRGRQVIAHRKGFDDATAEVVKLETEKTAHNLEVEFWNEIEKLLKPDGIEKALADLANSAFTESLKECDALAKVRMTPEMDISINGQRIASCSKSERLCGGIAFQAAMSKHLGTGFLVIDELDKLDADWKEQFHEWVSEARGEWIAGILALATSDADPPAPPPDGFRTLWIRSDASPVVLGGGMDE
jgi:hypothetical protein